MKITNKSHAYYNEDVKLIKHHEDGSEKVDLFVISSENIIEANLSDIAKEEESVIPQSRKEFYEYVQKANTCRLHISCTVKKLIESKKIVLNTITEERLQELINNSEIDKTEFLDEFRRMRDEGCFDFELTNAIYTNNNYKNKKPFQKRRNQ